MGGPRGGGRETDQADASGRVTRWGIKIAGDLGNAQWTFGALANQAEQKLMNEAGTEVYFNQPKTIEALSFWRSLSAEHHATPDGVSNWPQLSPDFLEGNAAIIQHTTGNLTNVRDKAHVPVRCGGTRRQEFAAHGGGWRQLIFLQERQSCRAAGQPAVRALGQPAGAGRRLVDPHRLHCDQPGSL